MADLTTLQEAQAYIGHIDNMLQLNHIFVDKFGNISPQNKIERSRQINPERGTIILAEHPTANTTYVVKKKLDILSGEIDTVIDFVKVEGTPQAPNEYSIPTTGALLFHPSQWGKRVSLQYTSIGWSMISASKIYVSWDSNGKVIETLEEYILKVKQYVDTLNTIGNAFDLVVKLESYIQTITDLMNLIKVQLPEAKVISALLATQIPDATQKSGELDTLIKSATDLSNLIKQTGNATLVINLADWEEDSVNGGFKYDWTHTLVSEDLAFELYKVNDSGTLTSATLSMNFEVKANNLVTFTCDEKFKAKIVIIARSFGGLFTSLNTFTTDDLREGINNLYVDSAEKASIYNSANEIVQAKGGFSTLKGKLDNIEHNINNIVYQLPPSNGIDDTMIFQNAIDSYKKVQISGTYIVSSLNINNNVEIIGKDNTSDIISQKSGATKPLITGNKTATLRNISLKGTNATNTSGIDLPDSLTYYSSIKLFNMKIYDFDNIGLNFGENRNMGMIDTVEILRCGTGAKIRSSDNLCNKLNIGDCNICLDIYKGGGNVFSDSCFFRATTINVKLEHQAFYSSFSNCSIDSSKRYGVHITQSDDNVTTRGHKFVGCSFLNNSDEVTGTYPDFYVDGAKGVTIMGCNFLTYDTQQVSYLVQVLNNAKVNFIGNSYSTTSRIPYLTSVTNNSNLCTIIDSENFSINSDINTRNRVNFRNSAYDYLIMQGFVDGQSYARFQAYMNGTLVWGDGTATPTLRLKRYNNTSLNLDGNFYADTLGVNNYANATTLGSVSRKVEIFNKNGVSLGFIPIYNSIS